MFAFEAKPNFVRYNSSLLQMFHFAIFGFYGLFDLNQSNRLSGFGVTFIIIFLFIFLYIMHTFFAIFIEYFRIIVLKYGTTYSRRNRKTLEKVIDKEGRQIQDTEAGLMLN